MRILKKSLFGVGLLIVCSVLFFCSGGKTSRQTTTVKPEDDTQIKQLKATILALQGTVDMINSFTESDYTNCSSNLPVFEQKICNIAQTSTAEQRLEFTAQLQQVVKVFQIQLYGTDCLSTTDIGCPKVGSVTSTLDILNTQVVAHDTAITVLQATLVTLQTSLAGINTRLNNFNGTSDSIELVINTIKSDVSDLKTRVASVEQQMQSNKVFESIYLCHDIINSGPIYEAILRNGDKTTITSYIDSGSRQGLGLFKAVGDSQGDLYTTTTLNTRTCSFKVYEVDSNTKLKVCWKNTNRSATSADIDNTCDFVNNFATPLTSCTCK